MKFFTSIVIFVLFLSYQSPPLFAAEPLILNSEQGRYSLENYLDVLEDPGKKLKLEDLLKPEHSKRFTSIEGFTNYGFTHAAFWIRFKIIDKGHGDSKWLLELRNQTLEHIQVYSPEKSGQYRLTKMGTSYPFDQREFEYYCFIYKIEKGFKSEKYFFIRVETDYAATLPMFIWEQESFIPQMQFEHLLQGIFFGFFLFIIVFGLILSFKLRELAYLYFSLYAFGVLSVYLSIFGWGFQFIWRESPGWVQHSYAVFGYFAIIFFLLFVKSFFQVKKPPAGFII